MNMNQTFWMIPMFALLPSCGVSMEDVRREILPQVEKNTRGLETLQAEQGDLIDSLSRKVNELQVTASTLDDRIKLLRERVLSELETQNAHLREVDRLQLEILGRTQKQLEERLRGTRELIDRLRETTGKSNPPSPDTPGS